MVLVPFFLSVFVCCSNDLFILRFFILLFALTLASMCSYCLLQRARFDSTESGLAGRSVRAFVRPGFQILSANGAPRFLLVSEDDEKCDTEWEAARDHLQFA